jgi:acyl-[acyl-carrier-protein]-phospholipid O-acyltransferase/long-chain-fatty-acid--[acyl-carrier-protein] ligase
MSWFTKSKFSDLSRWLSHLPFFSKPDKHSLHFLNASQFCGVLNDNIFKLVIAYLLIEIQGHKSASAILSTAGAIFVIPFLLFSSAAGVLADRFSKQRLLIAMKAFEICVMALALFAFGFQSVWGSYTLLFLLATHSALYGPSKYAIISELVPQDRISRANGLITSFTYLGMIFGTFLASFMTEVTDRNFVLVAGFCLVIAVAGFFSSFGVRYTPPQGSTKKIKLFFFKEIYQTLKFCQTKSHLLVAICGAAYFLFIGAFTQLNIIPTAIESLNLSPTAGGYLFLSTAFGIAFGSYIAGKLTRKRVDLGLPCLAGLFISLILVLVSVFSTHLVTVVVLLVLLGIFGGLFIVPFDTFVQLFSPDERRGQVIAANNFLSFCGVLLASFMLYFYSQIMEVSAAAGFAFTGFMTLIATFLLISRLSDIVLPYFAKISLQPLFRPQAEHLSLIDQHPTAILVLKDATWMKLFLIMVFIPKMHVFVRQPTNRRFPWFNWLFYSLHIIPSDESYEPLVQAAKESLTEEALPCIMMPTSKLPEILEPATAIESLLKPLAPSLIYADVDLRSGHPRITFSRK